jgi:putative FmdB family regulatory protein
VTYEYRCPDCGPFEIARPMGQAAATEFCTRCGKSARRVFTPPMVRRPVPATRLRDAAEASAYEPRVMTSVPPAAPLRPMRPADPRHALLPRP